MPLLQLHYGDLAFYESLGETLRKEDNVQFINAEKVLGIANTVTTLQRFQKSDFCYRPVTEIQEHILKFPALTAKEAEGYSVRWRINTNSNYSHYTNIPGV